MDEFFSQKVSVPGDVLVRNVAGDSVILNLKTETYFGLDEVGTRMWKSLKQGKTIHDAYESLIREYDVDPAILRGDFRKLIEDLANHGLLDLHAK